VALSPALFTDLYQLTMAQTYWRSGVTGEATFSLFFREFPANRAYYVFLGLQDALDYLEDFRFSGGDIDALRAFDLFEDGFLSFLSAIRFTGDVRAMDEGTLFFENEPVLEVSGPIIESQIVETYLLNLVGLQSMMATKAARVVHAASGRQVVDFAARRTHGTDAAQKLARSSYVAGFDGTSNVGAAATYGIPPRGTMAHSFVSAFPDEADAFRAYARAFPDSSTFLVDTYDTLAGVRNAITVGLEMRERGHMLRAVRLDSGALLELSRASRRLLDDAGLNAVEVFASGGLDEYSIDALVQAGAPIAGFGVGTRLGTSADAPHTDLVYKLVAFEGEPIMKLSTDKVDSPGSKQVYRRTDRDGMFNGDVIGREGDPPPLDGPSSSPAEPLLGRVMRQGRRLRPDPDLDQLRTRLAEQFARLPTGLKGLGTTHSYKVTVSDELRLLAETTGQALRARL
jgi:nicotinate phosphoribosyltransferase